MKNTLRIVVTLILLIQLGYLAYKIPQVILLDFDLTKDIKLSAVMAGIAIGVLFFTKEKKMLSDWQDPPKQ